MKPITVEHNALIPEQIDMIYHSSGSQGGDSGHGGVAELYISCPNIPMTIINNDTGRGFDSHSITIQVTGDWELEGLACAILSVGMQLSQHTDIVDDYKRWNTPPDYEEHASQKQELQDKIKKMLKKT